LLLVAIYTSRIFVGFRIARTRKRMRKPAENIRRAAQIVKTALDATALLVEASLRRTWANDTSLRRVSVASEEPSA
jgi:hypothetical protein